MTYSDFTLETVEKRFGLQIAQAALFPGLTPLSGPAWLQDILAKGRQLALISEKARSEFIVAPILLATRELCRGPVAIYSGQRLDVLPEQGLVGECDFILAATQPVPVLHAPLVTIVEAKKNDVEAGLGQCAAQMVAARLFNQNEGQPLVRLYGTVTTGEAWQFLRLQHSELAIDLSRYYIDNVGAILAALLAIFADHHAQSAGNLGSK